MGSLLGGKKGSSVVTGYRYYFSVLAGICRGPVDEIFLIKSDGNTFFDGVPVDTATLTTAIADSSGNTVAADPDPFPAPTVGGSWAGGPITDNAMLPLYAPNAFGGDKGQGGVQGVLWAYMGAKDQIIAAGEYIRTVMAGLRLSQMRGVVTTFFDGEITANNPYPKPWTYRIRRALKGWDGDVWYPEKAIIHLTDPAIPGYSRNSTDGTNTVWTNYYDTSGTGLVEGSTGVVTQQVFSTYGQFTNTTYTRASGTQTTYAVPLEYNDIRAMNPAHIIYECCTNRDWGRGMDRALIDNESFTDCANKLYDEGFGLCMKWSRAEDVMTFVQTVIDHIGAAIYTDRITGRLCMRLIRNDYNISDLATFSYDSGLLEVTNVEQAAQDAVATEIIVKYHSPVIDMDREARQQNTALIDKLGCVFSVTKDYSGIPTSTLALKAAQRELRVNAGGWKRIEFKVDRRGFRIVPGDVLILNAPERGLNNVAVRVATTSDSVMTDGSISIVGTRDIYGWPTRPMIEPEPSNFFLPDRTPRPIVHQAIAGASYRDAYKALGPTFVQETATEDHKISGGIVFVAARPTTSSLNYSVQTKVGNSFYIQPYGIWQPDWENVGTARFSLRSVTTAPIGVYDTVIPVTGEINPTNATIGKALMLTAEYETLFTQEYVRLDAITKDATTGITYITVGRGCVDTPALPHPKGTSVWAYDDTGAVVAKEYIGGDTIAIRGITHTMMGDLDPNLAHTWYGGPGGTVLWSRVETPYSGADFRVNGYPRDNMPVVTGDLVFTWKHRNRILEADTLVSEDEASVGPLEANTYYGVSITGTTGSGHYMISAHAAPGASSVAGGAGAIPVGAETFTIPASELAAVGIENGPMRVIFQTVRCDPLYGVICIPSYRSVVVDFTYGGETAITATSGFSTDFDNNFSGGV